MSRLSRLRKRANDSSRPVFRQAFDDLLDGWSVSADHRDKRRDQTSYSQFGEDKLLRSLLPERFGTYVDIGAGHPVRNSNTYYFYKRGWRGVLIEANPQLCKLLSKTRRRDKTINALVDESASDETKIWFFEPSELSTADEARANDLLRQGVSLREIKSLPSITLRDLSIKVSPEDPSLLSIDVEGLDLRVLRGNDWARFSPRVICVEVGLNSDSEIDDLLKSLGYEKVGQQFVSAIFVHFSAVKRSE